MTFTPGGSGDSDCAYQLGHKENVCVVCGRDDHNTKHHIVEYEYRKHYPEEYKSHNSYDIVVLCGPCHARYEILAAGLKLSLAKKYDAPVNGKGWYHDNEAAKVKKAARALQVAGEKLPADRKTELETIVKERLKKEEITEEDLKALHEGIDPLVRTNEYVGNRSLRPLGSPPSCSYKTHGELVYLALGSTLEAQQAFVELWRTHFLENMKPKFLPETWRVNKSIYKKNAAPKDGSPLHREASSSLST